MTQQAVEDRNKAFEKVKATIEGCSNFTQIKAAEVMVDLFKVHFPTDSFGIADLEYDLKCKSELLEVL